MPALKDIKGLVATFIKAKEALVLRSAFLSLSKSIFNKPVVMLEVVHQTLTDDMINKALMT